MDQSVKKDVQENAGSDKVQFSDNKNFFDQAEEIFELTSPDIRSYSGLSLAFIGDGVYELVIRTLIISKGNTQVSKMHRQCSELVKAPAQSAMIRAVFDQLTEEEKAVCRRGRNTKPHTKAKNASMADYRKATGLEALCGWLYLKHDQRRVMEIIRAGLEAIGYEK